MYGIELYTKILDLLGVVNAMFMYLSVGLFMIWTAEVILCKSICVNTFYKHTAAI